MHNAFDEYSTAGLNGDKEVFFARWIRRLMFFLLAVYPFGCAAFVISNKYDGLLWIDEQRLAFAMSVLPLVLLFLLWKCFPSKITKGTTAVTCCILFCVSVMLRLACSALLQISPVSDFKDCFDYAAFGVKDNVESLANYPYLGAYALTLRDFFRLYGPSVFNAQLLNAVITSIIPILLFLGIQRVVGKANVAVIAGTSYAIFPSMVIYASIPSCEHFSQFYMAAFICAIAYFCTEKKAGKRFVFACLAGIACGWLCVYKELMIVIAPAFLMVSFCYEILPSVCRSIKNRKFDYRRVTQFLLMDFLIIILALGLSKIVISRVQIELTGHAFVRNEPLSVTIYEGLCAEGGGFWNQEVKEFVQKTLDENPDTDEVNRILYGELISDYINNPSDLLRLLESKFDENWCNEGVYYYWTFHGEDNLIQPSWIGEILFVIIPGFWFMIMSAVICLGSILSMVRKDTINQRYFDFLVTGIVFLLAAALVLMESQGRYKSNVSPLICIMFALCMNRVLDSISSLLKSAFEKIKKALGHLTR